VSASPAGRLRAPARLLALIAASAIALAACSGSGGGSSSSVAAASPSGDPSRDKLAQVLARGTLVLWTDFDYAPQSFAVKGAARAANTKCEANQKTAPEVTGYDAETGKLVATALGVEPCFINTPWDSVIAGGWNDHWDVAWGSGAITASRLQVVYVTQPYYSTPANFFVAAKSTVTDPKQLSGKTIGVCSGCTHEQYLRRTLQLPGETLTWLVDNPNIVTYNNEPPGLQDVAAGKIDAFLCSEPVGQAEIKNGTALKELATPAFFTQKTGYVDKSLTLAAGPFIDRINAIIKDLHASGKLKALSVQFFGTDYTPNAATFDLAGVGQSVK
jgi:polar amino acid transport system substrate-binding protein